MRVQRETPALVFEDRMPMDQLILAPSQRVDKYTRPITEEERNSFNQEIADLTIRIDDKEDEKRAQTKMYNDDLKADKESRKAASKSIRTGMMEVADTIYSFPDFAENKVHEYNSMGERILTRRMKPNERQITIPNE